MDALDVSLWVLRLAFLAAVYGFLILVLRALRRDLRAAVERADRPLGRLVVLASPEGSPAPGAMLELGAANTVGRDVNNTIVIDDAFASGRHAALTYRGRTWYLEDLGSTNGTWLNGRRIAAPEPLGWGDEMQVGQVRVRLDRPPAR